jgi:hypothetical protein
MCAIAHRPRDLFSSPDTKACHDSRLCRQTGFAGSSASLRPTVTAAAHGLHEYRDEGASVPRFARFDSASSGSNKELIRFYGGRSRRR